MYFRYASGQTYRHARRNTSHLYGGGVLTNGQSNLTKGRIAAARGLYSIYFTMGRLFPPPKKKNCPFHWDLDPMYIVKVIS